MRRPVWRPRLHHPTETTSPRQPTPVLFAITSAGPRPSAAAAQRPSSSQNALLPIGDQPPVFAPWFAIRTPKRCRTAYCCSKAVSVA